MLLRKGCIDLNYIKSVQNLSLINIGLTKKNPSVACLIVDFKNDIQGKVISFGLTSMNGRPHAEINALNKIPKKKDSKDLTAYISLEPCFKKNFDSCSSALLKSGIKRIVIDSYDPNPIIYKKGYFFLKEKRIKIFISKSLSKFQEFNKYFYINETTSRPFITLKLAISKNGYTKDNVSKNVTTEETQNYLHYLRLRHDGICVGYNTYIDDKPKLTCRLPGIKKNIKKIILIKNNLKILKFSKDFNIINIPDSPVLSTIFYTQLSKLKIRSLLVEGGLSTFMLFFNSGYFNEIVLSVSKKKILSSKHKYKIKNRLFDKLFKYSDNYYGNDQIIVYKNNNV